VDGNYERAKELLKPFVLETPGDDELLRLMQEAEKGLENAHRAQLLFKDAEECLAAGDPVSAIERLREARHFEPQNQQVCRFLTTILVDHSRALAERDWRAAAPFLEEALDIDPGNPGAAGISQLISDMQQRERIDHCVDEARLLRKQNRLAEAITKVDAGLRQSPTETRLLRLRRELQRELDLSRAAKPIPGNRTPSAAAGISSEGPRLVRPPAATSYTEQPGRSIAPPPRSAFSATGSLAPEVTREKTFQAPSGLVSDRLAGSYARRSMLAERKSGPATLQQFQGWLLGRRSTAIIAGITLVSAIGLVLAGIEWSHNNQSHSTGGRTASQTHPSNLVPRNNERSAGEEIPAPSIAPPVSSQPPKPASLVTSFHFDSEPSAAHVAVDSSDTLGCLTPCDVPLPSGRHTFSVKVPGYSTREGVIQVPEERSKLITLSQDLKNVRIVSVPPGLAISLDGKPGAETPITLQLSVGKHSLSFKNNGFPEERTIEVTGEDFQHLALTLNSDVPSAPASSAPKPPSL
jgi:PEGA domain